MLTFDGKLRLIDFGGMRFKEKDGNYYRSIRGAWEYLTYKLEIMYKNKEMLQKLNVLEYDVTETTYKLA